METTSLKLELLDEGAEPRHDAPKPAPTAFRADASLSLDDGGPLAGDVGAAAQAVPAPPAAPVKIDVYAQQAAREYAQGLVDQPLWDRSLMKAHGDKAAAAGIYLQARGIALRVQDRHGALEATQPLDVRSPEEIAEERRRFVRRKAWLRYRYPAIGAAVLLAVVALGTVFLLRDDGGAASQANVPANVVTPAPVRAATPPAVVPAPAPAADAGGPVAVLRAKIDELRAAGNWNVLVLHAVEWTRLEPENAAAWNQLRAGYVFLRQYDDALPAARKAVQFAPNDASMWRRLGEVNVALDDPVAALLAYKEAVARDATDVASLQAVGMLATRLAQPLEARAAFDQALSVRPGDPVTSCLRSGASQLLPVRDPQLAQRQVAQLDAKCHGRSEGSVAVR